jgi:endonuclease/exonuclease/phosphatase family metal-dependent hydrolase
VATRGLLAHINLILAGDLNFTYDAGEMWGDSVHLDQLTSFFKDLFIGNKLVDITLDVLVSGWRNGRGGSGGISKRLDHVFLAKDLLLGVTRYKSWVEYPFILDHAPVFLKLDCQSLPTTYPFKFNSSWLCEEEVASLVREIWKDRAHLDESDVQ